MVKSHKRGSSSSPSSPNVGHHFFKVYLPSESSTRLKIPATFINDLSGALPKQIILKDSFRRLYRIEVKKVEGDFFFQNGWQAFVKKHSLVVGEFLVFRYDGNSMFEVNIYDHSGCEKEETSSDMNIDHSTRIVMVEDEEARETIRKCSREPQRKYSGIMKGVRKFGYGRTGTKPQRTDVGNNENDLVFKASGSYKQNASFNLFFDRHKPYHVHIPKHVLVNNTIILKPRMFLHDPSKRSWPVKVVPTADGRSLISSGWMDFCRGNDLKEKDKCEFEFLRGLGMRNYVIKVHITRANHA